MRKKYTIFRKHTPAHQNRQLVELTQSYFSYLANLKGIDNNSSVYEKIKTVCLTLYGFILRCVCAPLYYIALGFAIASYRCYYFLFVDPRGENSDLRICDWLWDDKNNRADHSLKKRPKVGQKSKIRFVKRNISKGRKK